MSSGTVSSEAQAFPPRPARNREAKAAGAGQHGASPEVRPRYVALTGNPNSGKTTLFNILTGLRAKVGNYAGVTVERKEGPLLGAPVELRAQVLDLPGTYSLVPQSLDEQISRDILLSRSPEVPAPSAVVIVADASNLQRNLYYAMQVIELGYPTIVALNMMDVAESHGHKINDAELSGELGVPVVPLVASVGRGVPELRRQIISLLNQDVPARAPRFCVLPTQFQDEIENLARRLSKDSEQPDPVTCAEALLLLSSDKALEAAWRRKQPGLAENIFAARLRLENAGIDWGGAAIEARYRAASDIHAKVTVETSMPGETVSDKLDRVVTHKIWGTLIFVSLMALMFQGIFTFAQWPMAALEASITWAGDLVGRMIPPGDLNSLLVDGVIAGVGAVLVFLPQILLLFLFIGFLEDTGYMARAAFLMDRLMSKVGLHGKSFIPMLSSFACAIPGIMATRTIESQKDRLVTILIAPLMSCSARLPVYTLLIAASIPEVKVLGFFRLAGLTLLGMYLLGIIAALGMAWVFKKTLLRGETPLLILELPAYKRPAVHMVLRHMWDRSKVFLKQAGTIILSINIILWFLATYPKNSEAEAAFEQQRAAIAGQAGSGAVSAEQRETQLAAIDREQAGAALRNSFAGRLGHAIEPVIAPLGFDWKIGIGIIASFAAREVFVSTMSTVYNVADADSDGAGGITQTLKEQKRPNGKPMYTPLTGITLMVFYVFALQCASTVAVVRKETNSWKWPIFQWLYLGLLAWICAFVTWQVGQMLGYG